MGYYTYFELSTKENKYKITDIMMYMKKEFQKDYWFYPFERSIENLLFDKETDDFWLDCDDVAKWYDFDKEMKELSKQFPETVFCLYGDGEESGDTWYQYYKNGKSQYCPAKISYDAYDESKLV